MGHQIAEAVIENGQLKHIDRKLPAGKLKVHLIYDTVETSLSQDETARLVRETSGLYKDIDAGAESAKLRGEWERNVH